MNTPALPQPYLLFLGDATLLGLAKTALGIKDWAPERCIGEFSVPGATVTAGLPWMRPAQARDAGARSLLIGVANAGGFVALTWIPALIEALESGLDIVSGLHIRLSTVPELRSTAERCQRRLIDVRTPPASIPVATGRKRSGKRLLAVGTDCALGKKYTALAIARSFKARGIDADFRATGQTGIMLAGHGIPMDAVISDFEAGAAEMLSPDAAANHWDVIEGQGSLFHPAYAAVSMGLLHGSQPDVIVVCHEAGRTSTLGWSDFALPTLEETIDLNLRIGRRTNPRIRCAGISLNTSHLSDEAARDLMARESARLKLSVADPIRSGPEFERLLDACLADW